MALLRLLRPQKLEKRKQVAPATNGAQDLQKHARSRETLICVLWLQDSSARLPALLAGCHLSALDPLTDTSPQFP